MTKSVSIGIIGTGFGKASALNFRAVDQNCNLYLFGRNKEKLAALAVEVNAKKTYSDWKELIENPEIDLVHIASPSGLHKEMFDYAVKFNKHILIEKPAALTSKDISEMIGKSKKLVVVNHEGRFHPVIQKIKELIDSGKLGTILTVRMGCYLNWFSNSDYQDNWNNYVKDGGGQVNNVGTHEFDIVRYLLNQPKIINGNLLKVTYKDPRFSDKADADNQFSGHFLTENNTSVQIFNDTYCFSYKDITLEIIGSKGIVLYSDVRGLKFSFDKTQPLEDVPWTDSMPNIKLGNSIISRSMKYMVKALIEAAQTNKTNSIFCTLEQAKENLWYFEKYNK